MIMEDVCNTLMQQNMIFIQESTPPPFRPSPGQSIKFPRGRKNGLARRQLQKLQTQGKDTAEKHGPDNTTFVPPKNYEIEFDREKVNEYLRNWEKKGYVKLKPDKLQWTPYLTTRIPQEENLPVLPAMDTTLDDSSKATSTRPNTPAPCSPQPIVIGELEQEGREDELPSMVEKRGRTRIQISTKLVVTDPLSVRSTRSQRAASASPLPTPLTPSRSLRTRSSNGIILRTLEGPASAVRPTQRGVLISKSSSRAMEVVNNDEAFAAKLALEEQMQHRQLRSRRNDTQSENKRPLPVPKARKRRRIDSSPEVVECRASEEQGAGENVGPMDVDTCMHTPERTLVDGNNLERMEGAAEREMLEVKSEDADTPVTSRQSVPSDDTVAGSNCGVLKQAESIFTAGVIDLAECHDEDAEGEEEEEDADGSPDPEY